jgi:3',5'-nucleoside bisphosphate phosphatase
MDNCKQNVDLHIHSCFSDGTMTSAEIVEAAKARGLALIAISDHNMLEGSRHLKPLCEQAGIGYLSAVELDCLDNGVNVHVLGYGVDLDNADFIAFTKRNRELLDQRSTILIEKMSRQVPGVSSAEYAQFDYDCRLGGWKTLHYFVSKGLAVNLKDGLRYYSQYDCPYSIVDFPTIPEVCRAVRAASGFAVLAHPGELIHTDDMVIFRNELNRLLELGLDGVECYYPSHTNEITRECIEICNEKNLIITAGSDCHGGFGKTSVGEMKDVLGEVRLKGLLARVVKN